MNILLMLIPLSLIMGGFGLAFFLWTLKSKQYDDPEGDSMRILDSRYDDKPKQ